MKKLILLIAVIGYFTNTTNAQNNIDNYSFMKLYVTNEKDEVILLGDKDGLEITGARYNDSLTVKEFVSWMGERMGIKIKNIRLRGLLTFHYAWRNNPTLMHYYTAEYESGDLVLPDGCEEIKWVRKNKTTEFIPFDEMNRIISKINECEYLFGGSFRIWKDALNKMRRSEFIEPFYRLN